MSRDCTSTVHLLGFSGSVWSCGGQRAQVNNKIQSKVVEELGRWGDGDREMYKEELLKREQNSDEVFTKHLL